MEEQKRYLVTAATGKTGVYTVQQLLDAGHAVRALVHTEDARADALRQLGAEVLVGDLLNHDDSIRATDGMTGATCVTRCVQGLFRPRLILRMLRGAPSSM